MRVLVYTIIVYTKMRLYRRACFSQTADKPEEKAEEEPELPPEVVANAGGVPIIGMVFESEEKA